jgi:hypothetical protein
MTVSDFIFMAETFRGSNPFAKHNLPEYPPEWERVTLYRKQLIDFRNNYRLLGEFAALVCGVPLEKFCKLDMMAYLNRRAGERKERENENHG